MRILNFIIFCIIALGGLVFALLNADPVTINYYIGTSKLPLSLLLVMSFIAGALATLLVTFVMYIRLKRENHHLNGRLKLAEKEVVNLRAMPLQDAH